MIDANDLALLSTARKMKRLQMLIGSKQENTPLVKALTGSLERLMGDLVDDVGRLDASREATIDG